MGEVYLGEQVSLGRKVAIKVLHADLMVHPSMIERFKREARLLSAVDHPAVVHVIDYGQAEVGACLVMEYVEGENLYDVLQAGTMAPSRALPLLYQLAEGLAAIHDKGIIHRDIKPENVLLTKGLRGEQARLLDFGIARLVEPDTASNLSQVGLVVGTPEYLSPEQAVGAPVDPRSDLYSFGVLAYRVLSGQLPFPGPGPTQYVAQHAAAPPQPLIEAAPTLAGHAALVSLVMRLLQKDPAQRLPHANALVDALGALAAAGAQGAVAGAQGAMAGTLAAAAGAPLVGPGITDFLVPTQAPSGTQPATSPPSGTVVFGGPPGPVAPEPGPAPSPSRAPTRPSSAGPKETRGGADTSVPGPSSTLSTPSSGSTLLGKPQNLTVMLTELQGYTERTSRQTHEQNTRMLERHDGLLPPLVHDYGGRLVQKRGSALLAVFPSPTNAVLCGMAMQDRLWRHNQRCAPEELLPVRICLHTGEVLVTRDAVLGEPAEVVKVVELAAQAGEVTFTESVNLARSRVEGDCDPCGGVPMPGSGEPLRLYRCRRAEEGLPFGGQDEVSLRPPLKMRLEPVLRPMHAAWGRVEEAALWVGALARANPLRAVGVSLGVVAVLGLGTLEAVRRSNPIFQARALLEANRPEETLKRLSDVTAEEKKDVAVQQLRARALHGLKRHEEEYSVLGGLEAQARDTLEDAVLNGLAEDFGEDEKDQGLRKLLATFPKERVQKHFESLADESSSSPRQWGALRYLEAVQSTDGLDLVKLYTRSLESTNCGVRARAARRLAALGDTSAVSALEQLSKLPRDKAVLGPKNCGQDEAEDALRALKKKK